MPTSAVAERLLTADEFMAVPDDPGGRKLELMDGRVVAMSQTGEEHGVIARALFRAMDPFVVANRMGAIFFDTGFILRRGPDRVVNPDLAFIDPARLAAGRDRRKAIASAPTLAVEVVSPTDVESEVAAKVAEYLAAGSERVWVLRPRRRTVTVHRLDGTVQAHGVGATLTSDDAGFPVEGFSLPVEAVFELD